MEKKSIVLVVYLQCTLSVTTIVSTNEILTSNCVQQQKKVLKAQLNAFKVYLNIITI